MITFKGPTCGDGISRLCVLARGHSGDCFVLCNVIFAGHHVCGRRKGHAGTHDSRLGEDCELEKAIAATMKS